MPPDPKPTLADSHCHIDMDAFDADRGEAVARAREAGVEKIVVVGCATGAGGHRRAVEVAEEFGLLAAAGFHPHDAKEATEPLLDEIEGWAAAGRIRAIGEIGLDFHYNHSPADTQRLVFRDQIRRARRAGVPVVVHTRAADDETASILEEEGAGETGGVIHCFSGGHSLAQRALALGFYLSFSGILTFPKADVIREVAREAPLDRILVETDSPFLAPKPFRGKRNEPAYVVEVARALAELRGVTTSEIAAATRRNLDAFLAPRVPSRV